jgi:hypothetical protein
MYRYQRFWPEDEIGPDDREFIPVSGQVPGVDAPENSHAGNDPPPAFQAGFLDPSE